MNIRITHLDSSKVFDLYSKTYNINRRIFSHGQIALEIKGISIDIINKLKENKNVFSSAGNDLLTAGDIGKFKLLAEDHKGTELGNEILKVISDYENYEKLSYTLGGKNFNFNKCYTMGILNITPDSFSDGGRYFDQEKGVEHALEMIEKGVDIIDVGGESTRPGAKEVTSKEEVKRVVPVIEKITAFKKDTVISIDTTKSLVAEAAIDAGAAIINDISGLVFDEKIADVAFRKNAAVVIMHIKGTPANMQQNPFYEDVISEVYDHLRTQTRKAEAAGIKKIFIDPGIGFGKRMEDNFTLMERLKDFKSLGYPIMIGLSRKSFIGKYFNLDINNRDNASAVAEAIAVMNGARIIRTHNVENGIIVRDLYNRTNNV